jgi:hypothetical protein
LRPHVLSVVRIAHRVFSLVKPPTVRDYKVIALFFC